MELRIKSFSTFDDITHDKQVWHPFNLCFVHSFLWMNGQNLRLELIIFIIGNNENWKRINLYSHWLFISNELPFARGSIKGALTSDRKATIKRGKQWLSHTFLFFGSWFLSRFVGPASSQKWEEERKQMNERISRLEEDLRGKEAAMIRAVNAARLEGDQQVRLKLLGSNRTIHYRLFS